MRDHRRVRILLAVVLGVVTTVALWRVFGTVLFAATVALVVEPVYRWLRSRGLSPYWASAVTTGYVFLFGVMLVVPLGIALYERRSNIVEFVDMLPRQFAVEVGGETFALRIGDAVGLVVEWFSGYAVDLAGTLTILGVKLTLFGIVLFALLIRQRELGAAILSAVPAHYHGPLARLERRARETLVAIYVLQAATAVLTFVAALVVFGAFGYGAPFGLAILSGVLQFLPIIGPSLVVAGLAVFDLTVGNVARAVAVAVVGWLLVAYLPDLVIRAGLANRTAHLPVSLYFVGFTGGVLTLGPLGIIVGPLVIALLFESLLMLAEDRPGPDPPPESTE